MTGFPVWFDENFSQGEIRDMLQAAGVCMTSKNGLMVVAKRIPETVKREEAYDAS